MPLVLSAAIALATGPKLIEWLRGHQMKTSENELGPKEHLKKRGTPIMGGLMIALGCIVSFVLCAAYTGAWVTTILPLLFVSLGSMAVGLADDWTKAVKHRSEGLTPWQKIIGLSVVCLVLIDRHGAEARNHRPAHAADTRHAGQDAVDAVLQIGAVGHKQHRQRQQRNIPQP